MTATKDLTKAQVELLKTSVRFAKRDDRTIVLLNNYRTLDTTRQALKKLGYVENGYTHTKEERTTLAYERDALIQHAKDTIRNDWQGAYISLRRANALEERRERIGLVLTEKGLTIAEQG